jgi:hypothetical protein
MIVSHNNPNLIIAQYSFPQHRISTGPACHNNDDQPQQPQTWQLHPSFSTEF